MPAGASEKREREYETLKTKFKRSRRYRGREQEVAARIVNKQRARYGETKQARSKDKKGESPDRHLPITDYQQKTIAELRDELERLSRAELKQVRSYERKHKNRKGMLDRIDRRLESM